MKAALRFVRKWWWATLLVLAVVFTVLWKILSGRKTDTASIINTIDPPKTLVDKARDQVEKVHLEGEVEKAKTRTVAEEHIKQIDEIAAKGKTEPKVARKELADFLAANL